jgi:hypothetical protein
MTSSSFTREPLRPLLDRKAFVEGRLSRWHRNEDGTNSLLLTTVQVRPYSPDVPLLSVEPITVDHLWLHGVEPSRMGSGIQLLGYIVGLGTVHLYARGDGSVDLGVRFMPSVDYTSELKRIAAWSKGRSLLEAVEAFGQLAAEARRDLTNGTGWVRDRSVAMPRVVRDLERHHQALQRDLDAEFRAQFGAAIRGGMTRRQRREQERNSKRRSAAPQLQLAG